MESHPCSELLKIVNFYFIILSKNHIQFHFLPYLDPSLEDDERIIDLLIENGANINQKDRSGNTPLMVACALGK